MSELPPNAGPPDDIDERYRRAAALDPGRPSDAVRRAVLEHAAKLAAERSLGRPPAQSAEDIPAKLGVERSAANQRRWRPAVYGTLAAAGLAGLLIAPQYLPQQAPSTAAQSKIEATRPRTDAAPAPPVAMLKESEMPAEEAPQQYAPSPSLSPAPSASASAPPSPLPSASPAAPPLQPPGSQSSLPAQSPPVMAQRQSMEKDRAAAGNAAVNADSAQDKASSYAAPPQQESVADARNAPAQATGAAAATTASDGAGATGISESITGRLAGHMTNARNQDSASALRRAAEIGDVQGLKVQLGKSSDIDARDADGRTALMLATLHGQVAAVDALLSVGADANAADAGGVTPLQAAMNANQPAIAAALRRAGAQ